LDIEDLRRIVAEDAAIRQIQRLQPIGGAGEKIMPAVYDGHRHAIEHRRIDGEIVPCAVLAGVPRQARLLSAAMLKAIRKGVIRIAYISVDFSEFSDFVDHGEVTTLDAPHRLYDAIFRDSETLDGTPFPRTELYQSLDAASPRDSRALFAASPTALLFGTWNSTGHRGGRGGKFARCLVSEIIAVGIAVDANGKYDGVRSTGRMDPLQIRRGVPIVIDDDGDWRIGDGRRGQSTPAQINHGNIPPMLVGGGVSADHCRRITALSCAALRRCRLPTHDELAAHVMLAALGLFALASQKDDDYLLRSRCHLVPDGNAPLEIVRRDGSILTVELDAAEATRLAEEAIAAARQAGVPWGDMPLRLRPQEKLTELVRRSREIDVSDEES